MRNRLKMKRARIAATIVALACVARLTSAESNAQDVAFRRAETFEDAHAASCRVCVEGARGTGFFVGVDGADAYVVTNCHVVTTSRVAKLDFWTNGKMESVTGRVVWRYFDVETPGDFAALVVDSGELKTIDPPFLALGGADARPSVGALIVSCGAPDGRFPQAWKGQILEYFNGATAVFSPPPVPGQSGSPICEIVDGELFVTGILTWLIGEKGQDDSKGGAIPIMNLYRGLNRPNAPVDFRAPNASAIPPGAKECRSQPPATPAEEDASLDFHNRKPIREFADGLKIFEDSDRRWRARGAKKERRQGNESDSDDAKANSKKGERLIDGALDALSKKIEERLDEKIDSLSREFLEKWNAVKYALLVVVGFAVFVAILIAEALVALLKTFARRWKTSLNVADWKTFNLMKGDRND